MVSVCLPSDALLQHLPSYLGFSYLGHGVSLHGCSSKAQPLLLTLDKGYLLTTALPDLQRGIAPLGPPKAQKMFVMDSTKHASNQALLHPTYEACLPYYLCYPFCNVSYLFSTCQTSILNISALPSLHFYDQYKDNTLPLKT